MPNLETILKTVDKMSKDELREHIRRIRDSRKIKTRVKKAHTIKGKRKTKVEIKKKFEKMSDAEKAAIIAMLKG